MAASLTLAPTASVLSEVFLIKTFLTENVTVYRKLQSRINNRVTCQSPPPLWCLFSTILLTYYLKMSLKKSITWLATSYRKSSKQRSSALCLQAKGVMLDF